MKGKKKVSWDYFKRSKIAFLENILDSKIFFGKKKNSSIWSTLDFF